MKKERPLKTATSKSADTRRKGELNMPGFDWNGNGSHDAFDSFMDMKVMGDVNSDNGSEIDSSEDYADDFDDASDYEPARTSSYSRVRHSSFSTERKASNGMSFQDELLQSMRTPETVKKENADKFKMKGL